MAERRMFAKTIIDSDAFLDMPLSAQALYFHLSMRADDDGFVNNPKKIQRMIGSTNDDYKLLIAKSFVLEFESGVIVIKHWRINNYIQKDRYKETVYTEEKDLLTLKDNGAYTLCIQDGYSLDTQVSIGKDSIDKVSIGKDNNKPVKHTYGEYGHVRLTDEERNKLMDEYGEAETSSAIKYLDEYIEMKGYKAKSHYLAIRKWVFDAVKREKERNGTNKQSLADQWLNA